MCFLYRPHSLTPPLVGRDAELAQLHSWLEKARSGERQLVFVTGEPGIGKISVVETFLQALNRTPLDGKCEAACGSEYTSRSTTMGVRFCSQANTNSSNSAIR
ncbi:MAG: AAA family ATPase [Candidatus Binatia bacterium]